MFRKWMPFEMGQHTKVGNNCPFPTRAIIQRYIIRNGFFMLKMPGPNRVFFTDYT